MSWVIDNRMQDKDTIQLNIKKELIKIAKISSAHAVSSLGRPQRSNSADLDTLAAAAHFAHAHGTPGIQAILSCPKSLESTHCVSPKLNPARQSQDECEKLENNSESKQQPIATSQDPPQMHHAPQLPVSTFDPSRISFASFAAAIEVLSRHSWNQEEASLILKFRAKYGMSSNII